MKSVLSILVVASMCIAAAGPALAASSMSAPAESTASASAQSQVAATEGEVRKVDLSTQKVTLKHGDIKNLGMPGMTMVFKVTDPKMLSNIKEGDKVRFTADRIDGALTVTSIEDLSN
jgi:Cu(I)/Ag(I) efflux system protein CusF